jgi:cell division protein FtsN
MTRENSPNPPPRPRHRRQGSCFFWFLTGGLLGALAVAIAWMMDERDAAGPVTAGASRAPPRPSPSSVTSTRPSCRNWRWWSPTRTPPTARRPCLRRRPRRRNSRRSPRRRPAKEAAKAKAKEAAKPTAKEPVKESGKSRGQGGRSRIPPRPPGKEAAKTPAKEPVKDPAKTAKTPEKPPAKPAEQTTKPPEAAPTGGDNETYILQVASLGSPEEAERFKAKLAQQGISVTIQQASVDGKTHYRIRTGPMKGKEAASKAKSQLAGKGFSPMMIKLK